jgi:chaperone required for assembly of F1-ATPase
VAAAPPFALAALSPIITIGGSLVLGLAVLDEAVLPEDAFALAHLDELWQVEQWGEDDLALAARAVRRRDFLAACEFLALL